MKKQSLLVFLLLANATFILSCKTSSDPSDFYNFKVTKWGPDEAKIGTVPNKQPDGKLGIWMDVPSTEEYGELQILFDGQPEPTATTREHVTCGITPEEISGVGEKKVELKQLSTGKIIQVGTFKVIP